MKIAYNPLGSAVLTVSPPENDITFDLPGKAIWAKGVKFGWYTTFSKDTSAASGYNGLVPAPSYNNNSTTRFLREDGTWVVPTNTTYSVVSSTANGLAPKVINTNTSTVTNTYYVLASTNGSAAPSWYKLPATTFANDNTTYTLSGALSGNTFVTTLTPSSGTATIATVPAMTAATDSAAGTSGLVPAPAAGNQNKFLKGDGTWATPTNSHYTTRIYAGASGTAANAATANPYLKVTDNNTYRNLVRFVGSGFTTVNSDANGNITISSTDTTYNVFGKTINSDFKTAYRTLTKGNTSQGYYIAAIRNDTSSVTDSPTYGSGLAFGMADTHGYLYLNYNAVEAYLGAGNADKLNWVKKLAFADGTGASGTWAISVSGNAATSSRLKILDLRGTNHLPNSSNYPSKHVTGWFNSTGTPNSEWYSGLTIKGWDNTYQTWLIASGSTTAIHERMYYRCGITNSSGTATWNDWKEIAFTSDFSGLFTAFSLSSGTLSATIGGTTKSVTLSISKLGTATVGATGRPIYLNAGTPTPITVSASTSTLYITGVTSSTSDIYTGTLSTSGVRIVGGNKLYAYSGFFESSDERLKDFYEDIDVDLEKLAQLPKKYFKWKDGSKELNIGTSAQELQKIYPELVSQDDQGLLSVAYDKLSIIALKGIDKLYKEMLELKQRINKLENYGNRC